ncbi:hypothetical protein [Lentzea sp. NBRC 102530]|uniref:hypothetical protein n=1 Tax=Lentzea sp. NBRC 102530 TaxID=3032201 RepID=UPI0024A180F2|nr:hypothetical protein [Lentzea sp. NBRC 102530]GLY54794.1 hypothetical protein Lesp01_84490 [Lentzea sp. NBRC 102530]
MTDHVFGGVSSPVLLELCLLLRGFFGDADPVHEVDRLADEDLYRHITFAASQRHSGGAFTARRAPELDRIAAAVLRRVSTGPLSATSPRSPQARYALDALPSAVTLSDRPLPDDKPLGALWTSSFLPDGTSMWQWGEWGEFGHDRPLFALTFDPAAVTPYAIGSPADYERLVNRYPRPTNTYVQVDWRRAAADLDAVHLTVAGLLTAQHVPVTTRCGTAMLTGWDAESTAWLRLPPGLEATPVVPPAR